MEGDAGFLWEGLRKLTRVDDTSSASYLLAEYNCTDYLHFPVEKLQNSNEVSHFEALWHTTMTLKYYLAFFLRQQQLCSLLHGHHLLSSLYQRWVSNPKSGISDLWAVWWFPRSKSLSIHCDWYLGWIPVSRCTMDSLTYTSCCILSIYRFSFLLLDCLGSTLAPSLLNHDYLNQLLEEESWW